MPICVLSLWLLLLHSQCTAPPVAPCFAVSVVCIALRFRCGAVLLSDTLNEKAVLPGHFHPLREKRVELQVWAVTVEDYFFFVFIIIFIIIIFFQPQILCLASYSVEQVLPVGSASNLHT